jgi:hypothetical protein
MQKGLTMISPHDLVPPPRRRRLVAVLVLATLALCASAAPGFASRRSPGPSTPEALARRVLRSADPVAAYLRLDPLDRATFRRGFRHQRPVVRETAALPAQSSQGLAGAVPASTIQGGGGGGAGCWQKYLYYEWHDFGIHDGDSWMQLNWCNDLYGTITSQSVTNVGGQGLSGVSYDGVIGSGSRIVSGQVRQFREYKFTLGMVTADPCLQIRGNGGGTSTTSTSCNLS